MKILIGFMKTIQGKTLGETWIKLVDKVLKDGEKIPDEKRDRIALQSVVLKSETCYIPDEIITKYGNQENISQLINMTFDNKEMHDFDVIPSFSDGHKSYFARLQESNFIEYAVERLTLIPESKKVIMVYPEWEDYIKVRRNHYDDYLPCVVAVQLRMLENKNGSWNMNIVFFARSADIFQKFHANMIAMVMLAIDVSKKVSNNLGKNIYLGSLEGMITDAHIYDETLNEAKELIKKYELEEH